MKSTNLFSLISFLTVQVLLMSNTTLDVIAKEQVKTKAQKTEKAEQTEGVGVHQIMLVGLPRNAVQPNKTASNRPIAEHSTLAPNEKPASK